MTSRAVIFLIVAVGALALRLFTGIVYLTDDPTTYFVLKRTPSFVIEQTEGKNPVKQQFIVLAEDELKLIFQTPYTFAMQAAPWLALACLIGTFVPRRKEAFRMLANRKAVVLVGNGNSFEDLPHKSGVHE